MVTRPSRFSNPWKVTTTAAGWEVRHTRTGVLAGTYPRQAVAHRHAVERFRVDLFAGRLPVGVDDIRRELAGRDLGCACPPELPCHVDVLLEVANPAALAARGGRGRDRVAAVVVQPALALQADSDERRAGDPVHVLDVAGERAGSVCPSAGAADAEHVVSGEPGGGGEPAP